ncbi:hypothetical protein ASPZODRAFT_161462 [Penicilliopsis zonata CBS 506.65]|uniref:Zn(2)-C6 fungal-type domain-containing protein n=1 Tax=Penicilliopsis zonata CBS 506.65 TaxID=1073090 RepID=A0A1L9S8N0_9EURO|nr:hypothetical protein ASPZODRAFT_161462 [Penicilliopsis zonata CBS 506.65]OJJ43507.1 hypothetical protein ASPZODRAFT_161462 [Penicilliopsis zonata CBS 506.65]
MERSKPAPSSTSTYGQAYTPCYKAKCRCVRAANGDNCERCIRLGKRCEASESVRKRNTSTTPADVSDTRIARLEDKMESLLSAMTAFVSTPGGSLSSINILQTPSSNRALVTPTSTNLCFNEGPAFSTKPMNTVSPNSNSLLGSNPYSLSPSFPLANLSDERLHFFRSRMLPSFPFLNLTPDMTSWYLRQKRPFLLQSIRTVTTFSTQERFIQSEELKRLLLTSALIKVESNIDLLLGLLTYLAWSTDAFLGRADLVSRLMMLAISMIYDLWLFKSSSPDAQIMMTITQGRDEKGHIPGDETPHDLLERQRAVLACFILSSNVSSHLRRQDALQWTPQMEEALQFITISKACAADQLFVAQVRLQLLKQRASDVQQQDETNCTRTGMASAASVPRILYLKTLRRQLHELKSSFSADLQQINILNTHAQYVELYINQLANSISQDAPPLDLAGRRGDGGILRGFERLDCLWQSVENVKSWLATFYEIPPSKLVGQPFHFWSQMVLSITLLKYLSTLTDPDWNVQAVRSRVNPISTMDSMLNRLGMCNKEPELQCSDHLLGYLSKLLFRCRVWAEYRWGLSSDTRACQSEGHSNHIPDLDEMVWM